MIGAIAGDIIGSVYEWKNIKTTDFELFSPDCRFTDDSIMTIALADAILSGENFADKMKEYYQRYPDVGYGEKFAEWASSDQSAPYNSYGNGAAMRISPVGYAFSSLDVTLQMAEFYTSLTHNHPEGIKGGCSTAAAIFMARRRYSKQEIKQYIETKFGYDLSRRLDDIRPDYKFDVSCQGSVPEAMIAFLESDSFEDAIRKAVSLGGDSDTIACITGGIAQAFYGDVPDLIEKKVYEILDEPLKKVTKAFMAENWPD